MISKENTLIDDEPVIDAAEYQECAIDDATDAVSEALASCADALDEISDNMNGGIALDLALGAAAGLAKVIIKDADAEEVVETALETVVPFGEAITDFSEGNEEGAIVSASADIASLAGGIALSKVFLLAGGAAGLAGLPLAATVGIGAAGLAVGSISAGYLTEKFMEKNPALVEKIEDGISFCLGSVGVDVNKLDEKYEKLASSLNQRKDRFFNRVSDMFNFHGAEEDTSVRGQLPTAVQENAAPVISA